MICKKHDVDISKMLEFHIQLLFMMETGVEVSQFGPTKTNGQHTMEI